MRSDGEDLKGGEGRERKGKREETSPKRGGMRGHREERSVFAKKRERRDNGEDGGRKREEGTENREKTREKSPLERPQEVPK